MSGDEQASLSAAALQMLVEPRHDLHEIARHMPVVELWLQYAVPGVLAGAGRAGQREDEGATPPVARDWIVDVPILS